MAGNLAEWCEAADGSPCAMGGSWLFGEEECRCGWRICPDATQGYPFIGFRVAAVLTSD
jgi:formylglycine-generating enzyme required for sulfatase activity